MQKKLELNLPSADSLSDNLFSTQEQRDDQTNRNVLIYY